MFKQSASKKDKTMTRQEYNRKILEKISKEVENNPDFRFIQLLWKMNIVNHEDKFYEESKETYSNINNDFTK